MPLRPCLIRHFVIFTSCIHLAKNLQIKAAPISFNMNHISVQILLVYSFFATSWWLCYSVTNFIFFSSERKRSYFINFHTFSPFLDLVKCSTIFTPVILYGNHLKHLQLLNGSFQSENKFFFPLIVF